MVKLGNVDSFADAMNRALSDEANAKRVGACGLEVAKQQFNTEVQAKRLADFLKENLV